MMSTLFGLMSLTLLSCSGGGTGQSCSDEEGCDFGESCVDGLCVEASCNSSQQCPMEHYCGTNRSCEAGCGDDDDCYPGDRCSEGQCEPEGCTETAVDCGYRQFCNTGTGECYDAGNQYCKPCSDDSECGEGNFCWADYCGVDCTYNECPSGFGCYPVDSNGNLTSVEIGNVFTYQCLTYCWLYEDYEAGSFLVSEGGELAPPPALPRPTRPVDARTEAP